MLNLSEIYFEATTNVFFFVLFSSCGWLASPSRNIIMVTVFK